MEANLSHQFSLGLSCSERPINDVSETDCPWHHHVNSLNAFQLIQLQSVEVPAQSWEMCYNTICIAKNTFFHCLKPKPITNWIQLKHVGHVYFEIKPSSKIPLGCYGIYCNPEKQVNLFLLPHYISMGYTPNQLQLVDNYFADQDGKQLTKHVFLLIKLHILTSVNNSMLFTCTWTSNDTPIMYSWM